MTLLREQKELKLELLKEKRRRSFFHFLSGTIPRYQDSVFYHDLSKTLQEFGSKLENKEFPHYMINMAPRVGKSASILRFFLWMMIRYPGYQCIYATYSDRLSKIMSREMKTILDMDYIRQFWPDIRLRDGHSALDHWSLNNGSSIFFTSIGGSISGIGFNIAALDDIFASMETAQSEAYRSQMFSWVSSAFMTRGLPEKHGIIFNFTRWIESDLAGFVEKEERNNPMFPRFDKTQYPIIDEQGKSLIPERFSEKLLSQIKAKVGTKVWEALYMCNPRSDSDRILSMEWIEEIDTLPLLNWNRQEIIVTVDTAFKGKTTSDYNACVCLGKGDDNKLYLIDYLRIQADFTLFLEKFAKWYSKLPSVNTLILEDKANGSALQSVLKQKFHNIKMVNPDTDKISRTSAVAPMVEAGSLVFLRKKSVDYLEIKEEVDKFPAAPHDDFVDALTMGLQHFLDKSQNSLSGIDWDRALSSVFF
jgi:predicted phage terminase large subunit-like protein